MLKKFCFYCCTYIYWFSDWINGWYVSIQCITAEVDGHCSPDTAYHTVTAVHSGVCGGPRSHLHHPGSPDPGAGRRAQLQVILKIQNYHVDKYMFEYNHNNVYTVYLQSMLHVLYQCINLYSCKVLRLYVYIHVCFIVFRVYTPVDTLVLSQLNQRTSQKGCYRRILENACLLTRIDQSLIPNL